MSENAVPFNLPVTTDFGLESESEIDDATSTARRRLPDSADKSLGMVIRSQLMEREIAASLGVAGAGEAEAQGKSYALVYEISLAYGERTFTEGDGRVMRDKKSVGFQAGFWFDLVDTSMKVNLVALQLASQFQLASSSFFHDDGGIRTLSNGPAVGVLSQPDGLEQVTDFLEKARDEVAKYNGPIPTQWTTEQIGSTSELDADQAIIFALRGIMERKPLGVLLEQNASKSLDPWQITATYHHITKNLEYTAQPTVGHRRIAIDYLEFKVDTPKTPAEAEN